MGSTIRVLELRSVRGTGGGPEKTILLGAARAPRSEFQITVCYLCAEGDPEFRLRERARALGLDYVEIAERHSLDPAIWSSLVGLVRDRGIQIVHGHEYKTDLLAWRLARRAGVVPLATVHGWSGASFRERWLYYPLDKRILTRFPHVIAVSTNIRDELVRRGARADRVSVLLNAVDADVFRRTDARRAAIRNALGLPATAIVAGSVGRLEREKRYDLLIEAMAPLMRDRPDLHVVIAGAGTLQSALTAQAAALGLADRVKLLGHRDDAVDVHAAFDVFVQSSETEGTPNAVLEAMAMTTPIVATDVGGTRELVTDGVHARLVPRHDVPALTAAVRDVLDHPDLTNARTIAARARVERELSFDARTERLSSIYRALLSGRDTAASPVHAHA